MSTRYMNPDLDEEMLEDEQNESQDEVADELPRIQPRPPRASLTHHAIKTELMKMNKQNQSQKLAELSMETDEDNLSRAARKRKRRREKVLEERRASGRSEDMDEDFANFKSVSIARRRSSVLPANAVFHHHQDSVGCASYPSKTSCWSRFKTICWWLFIIGSIVTAAVYVWPLIDTEPDPNEVITTASSSVQSAESLVASAASGAAVAEDALADGGPIESNLGTRGDQPEDIVSELEANGAVWFVFKEAVDTINSLIFDRDAALGEGNEDENEKGLSIEEETTTNDQGTSYWWSSSNEPEVTNNQNIEQQSNVKEGEGDEDDDANQDEQVPIELDVQTALDGQHIDEESESVSTTESNAFDSFGWFWATEPDLPEEEGEQDGGEETNEQSEPILNKNEEVNANINVEPSFKSEAEIEHELDNQLLARLEEERQMLRAQNEFNELKARELVDQMVEDEQQLDRLKEARQHLRSAIDEPEMFECGFETDSSLETTSNVNCNDRHKSLTNANQPEVTDNSEIEQSPQSNLDNSPNDPSNQTPTPNSIDVNPFYEYDPFF